jgi:hypothetical protein
MRDISSKGGCVADLRSRNQITGFDQCLGMRTHQGVERDSIDRDGSTDEEVLPSHFEGSHLMDRRQIN